jgi:hypothetical protein
MAEQRKKQWALLIPVYIEDVDGLLQALEFSRSFHKAKLDEFYEKGLSDTNVNVTHLEDIIMVCNRMIDKIRKYRKRYQLEKGC